MEEGFYYRINGKEEIPCVITKAMTLDGRSGLAVMDFGERSGPAASTYKQYRKMDSAQIFQLYLNYCNRRDQFQKVLEVRENKGNEESMEDSAILERILESISDLESRARRFRINLPDSNVTKKPEFTNNPFGNLAIP